MKKNYQQPKIEVFNFKCEDVIRTSGLNPEQQQDGMGLDMGTTEWHW